MTGFLVILNPFFQSFDQRFALLSSSTLDRFTELATTISSKMSNPLFLAEPELPFCKPIHGQDPSLSPPVSIGGSHHQFQGEGEDPVPQGLGYAQPSTSSKLLDRDVSIGLGAAQSQAPPFCGSGPAQSRQLPGRARVYFGASTSLSPLNAVVVMGEGMIVIVMSDSPVMDETSSRLVSFVYEQYPESRPFLLLLRPAGSALIFWTPLLTLTYQKDLN